MIDVDTDNVYGLLIDADTDNIYGLYRYLSIDVDADNTFLIIKGAKHMRCLTF